MNRNIGLIDRLIRLAIAVAIAVLGIVFKTWWGLLALIPLATALFGICPLYSILGLSTRRGGKTGSNTPPKD
jgi:hypothetical protein